MARDIAPHSQWQEPVASAVASDHRVVYPYYDAGSGMWSVTPFPALASGRWVASGGDIGIDNSATTGGLTGFMLAGTGGVVWIA